MDLNDLGLLGAVAKRLKDLQASIATLSKQIGPQGDPGKPGRRGEPGKPGVDGRDGADGKDGIDGKDGVNGIDGEPGAVGPKPKHEWIGTKLRFEQPDGSWGPSVDLKGKPGKNGSGGGGGVIVTHPNEDEEMYAKRIDWVDADTFYRAEASVGSAESEQAWRVRKVVLNAEGDVTETWAEGDAKFDKKWADRASYAYS